VDAGAVSSGRRARRPSSKQLATARLVQVGAADDDRPAFADLAIRAIRGRAAHHADRQRLGDVLRDREQLGHRLERPPAVVLVEAGDDDALALAASVSTTATRSAPRNWPSSMPMTSASCAWRRISFACDTAREGS
jgi:hypothetical protein